MTRPRARQCCLEACRGPGLPTTKLFRHQLMWSCHELIHDSSEESLGTRGSRWGHGAMVRCVPLISNICRLREPSVRLIIVNSNRILVLALPQAASPHHRAQKKLNRIQSRPDTGTTIKISRNTGSPAAFFTPIIIIILTLMIGLINEKKHHHFWILRLRLRAF